VGFPGETEDDFRDTMSAVDKAGFSRIHVFKYSRRDGTRAASMEGQVAEEIKTERSRKLIEAGKRSASEFIMKNAGSVRQTLFLEQTNETKTIFKGITDNDITVLVNSKENPTTQLHKTRLSKKAKKEPVTGTLLQAAREANS
jgi:threonylcarbamoyladenosine tRNA methylthiotransferase MtaB